MDSLLRNLISDPVVRAQIQTQIRNLLGAATGALALWLGAHLTSEGTATLISGAVLNIAMAFVTAYLGHQDVKNVDAKINKALSLAPNSPSSTIDALKQGTFGK